mmetsp:Transcript_16249/g.31471  ORF Transcript_16249/g.31471 Transcript_16249/m.31471 type:complete len:445 (-) Transcript_16249:278-1612(-)
MAQKVHVPSLLKSPSETTAFGRNAENFLSSRLEERGEVFGSRILQWPVIFAASYKAVETALTEDFDASGLSSKHGYASFTGLSLFGDTVLFQDGEDHTATRKALRESSFANKENLESSGLAEKVRETIHTRAKGLLANAKANAAGTIEIGVYDYAKELCAEVLHASFLACHHGSDEKEHDFKKLHQTMWRGTVSSGANVDVSLLGFRKRSAFNEAKEARQHLAAKFAATDDKHADLPASCPFQRNLASREERVDHYIMFTSSMVSKAVGSIVASFVMLVSQDEILHSQLRQVCLTEKSQNDLLLHTIYEVERLYPPVIGCCRTATKDMSLCGYSVPAGSKLWCSFLTANRDSKVFPDPMKFDPGRWSTTTHDPIPLHFSYGLGEHCCIGQSFARFVVETICCELIRNFETWETLDQIHNYRWLPVARPDSGLPTRFIIPGKKNT